MRLFKSWGELLAKIEEYIREFLLTWLEDKRTDDRIGLIAELGFTHPI